MSGKESKVCVFGMLHVNVVYIVKKFEFVVWKIGCPRNGFFDRVFMPRLNSEGRVFVPNLLCKTLKLVTEFGLLLRHLGGCQGGKFDLVERVVTFAKGCKLCFPAVFFPRLPFVL